jgi:penicillin-binding protein 2
LNVDDDKVLAGRILVLRIIMILGILVLCCRLYYMQGYKGDWYQKKSEDNMIRFIPVPADRGAILDRHGNIIAKNNPRFTISLLSYQLTNSGSAIMKVAEVLQLKSSETKIILRKVQENPFEPIKIRESVDYETLSRLAEIQGDYPGVYIEAQPQREYPFKELACHVIGYTGEINLEELEEKSGAGYQIGDFIGKDGLEKQYDRFLRGKAGARQVLLNVEGKMVRFIGEDLPRTGSAVELNIDRDLQKVTEDALRAGLSRVEAKNHEPSGGAVVVITAQGEILSMASLPNYDLNLFSKGISFKDYSRLLKDRCFPLLNRVVHCSYPCASTYKMITGSAALHEGLVKRGSRFHCAGVYDVDGTPFNCFVRRGHGDIDFLEAIAQSCDVVFYKLAHAMDLEKFLGYSREFGIGSPTGIDLPGENSGLLPTPEWKKKAFKEEWYAGDTINLSIGQGYLGVTPLQVAVVTAAVANGGTIVRPHVVRRIISSNGPTEKDFAPEAVKSISIPDSELAVIREGMRGAVTHGTATSAHSSMVEIAGKTGTAENFPTADNPHGRNHTWFTCFAPYKNPEIIVTVFIEKSGGFGGEWCGPVARKIIETYYRNKHKEGEAPVIRQK